MRTLCLAASLSLFTALPFSGAGAAFAQTTISGDISGTVVDPTGAALPGAKVVATNNADGATSTVVAGSSGEFRISLLKPGTYTVTVSAISFGTTTSTLVVSQGSVATLNAKLTLGSQATTIEVTDTQPLLQVGDAQITTTFTQEQVQTLPNPGGDITYYAQTAPGVVMNTGGGGYGNFSVFGLPGTSNNFTVNGEQENDPFLNLNNSGPTNLLLGQNDISSVSVITSAYGAEFGSFGGAQVNETSRSGTNHFHGDASYYWNGNSLDANNWFIKNSQVSSGGTSINSASNNNQWSAAVGGPIFKDKTFFFFNTEGIRFISSVPQTVFVPSAAYQAYILGPSGNCDPQSSLAQYGAAAQCGFYKSIFSLFNKAPGINKATALAGGPTLPTTGISAGVNPVDPGQGIINTFEATPKLFAKESLVTARLDQVFGTKDSGFMHFKYDNGTQPTNVDPISSLFNDVSFQPEYEGQLEESHSFTPNLVNQFLFTAAHYGAYFQNVNQSAATAALPFGSIIFAEGFFSNLGGIGYVFPQGRNATQYQFADDLSYTFKKHSMKAGYAFKKDDITNFDTGVYTNPLVEVLEAPGDQDFEAGTAYLYRQTFPNNLSNPNGLYTEGFYIQDNYKASSNLTIIAGIRFEHNSNPVCPHSCFSRLNQNLSTFFGSAAATNTSTPYNAVVSSGLTQAFSKFQAVSYEPRVEISYLPAKNTLIRAGFGMFSDVFPGQVADNLLRNIPQDPRFQVQFANLQPSVAGSGAQLTAQSNALFKSGNNSFANGGSYSSLRSVAAAFVRPNISTANSSVQYPTYEEYSLEIQQQITPSTVVEITYAGNHGYHEPVVDGSANAYSPGGAFGGLPAARPGASFGEITNLSSTASSNYNGGVVSIVHRTKAVTAQVNYTYSHTLDQISNGGFLGFTSTSISGPLAPENLKYNYGNADYDVRHSLNGNYLVNLPSYGTGLVKSLTGGFTVAGTVFYRAGFPFTVTDSNISNTFGGTYTGGVPALVVAATNRHCNGTQGAISGCLSQSTSVFQDPTAFIPGQRNAFFGPHYFNTDMTVNKAFTLSGSDRYKMIIGANFYNVLNHPNFANPSVDVGQGIPLNAKSAAGSISPNFGHIFSTVSVPTSIYGSGLGGDASIRVIQLHAKVSF